MSYQSEVLADSPAGYWRLGEAAGTTGSGSVLDASGNAIHGTPNGGITFGATGIAGSGGNTAATFNGTTGYIDLGSTFVPGTSSYTFELWVKQTGSSSWFPISSRSSSSGAGYEILLNNGNNANSVSVRVQTTAGGVAQPTYNASPSIDWTAFHHIVGVIDVAASVIRIYFDGVEKTNSIYSVSSIGTTQNLYIGRRGSTYGPGTVDEVAIYPTALSAARILAHYNAGIASGYRFIDRTFPRGICRGAPRV